MFYKQLTQVQRKVLYPTQNEIDKITDECTHRADILNTGGAIPQVGRIDDLDEWIEQHIEELVQKKYDAIKSGAPWPGVNYWLVGWRYVTKIKGTTCNKYGAINLPIHHCKRYQEKNQERVDTAIEKLNQLAPPFSLEQIEQMFPKDPDPKWYSGKFARR